MKPNGRRFTAWERMAGSSSSPSRMLERTPIVGCRAPNSDSLLSREVQDVRRSPALSSTQGAHFKPNGRRFTASERMTGSSSSPSRMLERTPIVGCSFKTLIIAKWRQRLLQKSRSGVLLPVEPTTIGSLGLRRHRNPSPSRTLEPTAEVGHEIDPRFAVQTQPLENGLQSSRYRSALAFANLPPRPIQERQVLRERDRQEAPVRRPRADRRRSRFVGRRLLVRATQRRRDLAPVNQRGFAWSFAKRHLAEPSVRTRRNTGLEPSLIRSQFPLSVHRQQSLRRESKPPWLGLLSRRTDYLGSR